MSFLRCGAPAVALQRRLYLKRTSWLPSSLLSVRQPDSSASPTTDAEGGGLLSSEAFARLAPILLLQKALRQHTLLAETPLKEGAPPSPFLLTRAQFDRLCRLSHVADSEAALQALHDAALVVSLDAGRLVHLRPVRYVEAVELAETLLEESEMPHEKDPALPVCFLLTETERRVAGLIEKEAAMRRQLEPAIARAARWRRLIWSAALLFAGGQLAAVARLTYVEFDWDVMEPVSYCLSIGTALIFLLYFVWYGELHSYAGFDRRHLPKKVRQYARKDFDWEGYEKVCAQLVDERKVLEQLREWARTH
ncbi:unnamed protein product [Phytomonas sp. EM1]|nr:unnamed protein product [Phytomonas sp. EM1]|eukprot:CCW60994.1 unnamed protein product [Phytomonas sp. isolate EM1]